MNSVKFIGVPQRQGEIEQKHRSYALIFCLRRETQESRRRDTKFKIGEGAEVQAVQVGGWASSAEGQKWSVEWRSSACVDWEGATYALAIYDSSASLSIPKSL